MKRATCECGETFHAGTVREASDQLWAHHDEKHLGRQPEIVQLDSVTFYEAFFAAIRAMPVGHEFTTADLHALVPSPLDHHWWGKAQSQAKRLGLCERIGTQTSDLDTTKDSLVRRWRRTEQTRGQAA